MDKKAYKAKWERDNTKIVIVRLNNNKHAHIIEHLKTVPNVSDYVRDLIEKDINEK